VQIFEKIKQFFSKDRPYPKGTLYPKRPRPRKVVNKSQIHTDTDDSKATKKLKVWSDLSYKDYYCKYIENNTEVIRIITNTFCTKYSDGRIEKRHCFAGDSHCVDADVREVILLGRSVDQLTRLKYEKYRLSGKVKRQADELIVQQNCINNYILLYSRQSIEMNELRKILYSKYEIEEYLKRAIHSPAMSLLSEEPKERDAVAFILRQLEDSKYLLKQ